MFKQWKCTQTYYCQKYELIMSDDVVSIVIAEDLSPLGAKTSVGAVMKKSVN